MSMARQERPVISAAISVVPEPLNGSTRSFAVCQFRCAIECPNQMNDPNGPTLHYDRMIELNEFYKKASELFGPYIQAHQKV
jgi:hypothetical protein